MFKGNGTAGVYGQETDLSTSQCSPFLIALRSPVCCSAFPFTAPQFPVTALLSLSQCVSVPLHLFFLFLSCRSFNTRH